MSWGKVVHCDAGKWVIEKLFIAMRGNEFGKKLFIVIRGSELGKRLFLDIQGYIFWPFPPPWGGGIFVQNEKQGRI